MSAIFGMVRFDGAPVEPELPAAMSGALAHRGAAERVVLAGSAVLGIRGPGDGSIAHHTIAAGDRPRRIVVVADGRLDGPVEHSSSPGVDLPPAAGVAERILRSYLRHGDGIADRLLGDFAFAIWDERHGRLTLSRDSMGVKPLYLYRQGGMVAFASEIRGLLALPGVSREIDEEQLAVQLLWGEPDREGTIYRAIRRLPAAHTLTLVPGSVERAPTRYWSLDAVQEVRRADPREYAEGLAELLALAVRDRMRDAPKVATALSGGLDSSTITCLARREVGAAETRELHAISLVFESLSGDDQRLIDEREYMRAVADRGGLTWHAVRGDTVGPLGEMDAMLEAIGQPFAAPNVHLHWQMYGRAAAVGASVFLDGVDGDTAISHGFGRLNGHLARGEWDDFAREVRAFAARDGRGAGRVLEHYGLPYLEDLATEGRWAEWIAASRALTARFPLSRRRVLWHRGVRPAMRRLAGALANSNGAPIGGDLLEPGVVDRLRARAPALSEPRATLERDGHRRGVMQPAYQQTLEIADACAARWGVTPRYPFFDRRVLEYCVSLPDEEKLGDGWSRLVLRRAMDGVLPPEVQWRVGKSNLSPAFAAALRGSDRATVLEADLAPLAGIARSAALEKARERLASDELARWGDADGYLLYRAVIASRWMTTRETRGTVAAQQEMVQSGRTGKQVTRRRAPAA